MSAGISDPEFDTWFDGLEHFKKQIKDKAPDFVIVGAGAWSLPIWSSLLPRIFHKSFLKVTLRLLLSVA
mgnify:CR=1 FL=1